MGPFNGCCHKVLLIHLYFSFPFSCFFGYAVSLDLCSRRPVAVVRPSHVLIYHWFHSLMYGAEDPSIAGMVLDSPFSDLVDLMMELVETYKFRLPKFTVSWYIQPHYENYIIHWFTTLVYFVWWFIIPGNKWAYNMSIMTIF